MIVRVEVTVGVGVQGNIHNCLCILLETSHPSMVSYSAVGVAVAGSTNNVPGRLSSSSEELPVSTINAPVHMV